MNYLPRIGLTAVRKGKSVRINSLVVIGCVLSGWAMAQTPSDIDRLTQQWLDTERQISHLESDWLAQQPLLEQRITLLRAERGQLQNILADSNASQDDVDAKREALLAQQAELEAEQQQLVQALDGLINRLNAIQPLLPDPVRSAWESEQAMLSAEPDASEQLQVALAKLSSLADFNTRITVQEAPMTLPGGSKVMVKQLYLGTGSAWFVSADGNHSGYGQAGIDGWQWRFDNAVNPARIADAIAIYERQQQAAFVHLPVVLQNDNAGNLNASVSSKEGQP